ncbi:septum formation protein Maf [Candidatus Dojkabacteria bacterium]|nr:septum formation protein Maf [Candidatus Dojkabacteria bacterium]
MSNYMKLILASQSPQKRSLLNKLGLVFQVENPDIDEKVGKDENPESYVRRIALEKAEKISKSNKDTLIIAHDMVIDLDGEIIGKPKDAKDAKKILKSLSGREHEVVSSAVLMLDGEAKYQGAQRTTIKFRKLSAEDIEKYIKTEEWMEKAGAYAIQGEGGMLVESIEGSYFNIVGLPLTPLIRAFQKEGVEVDESVKQTIEMQEDSISGSFPR